MKCSRTLLAALFPLLLTGCVVGPKYVKPAVPMPPTNAYKELGSWKAAQPSDQVTHGKWWEIFGDTQLDAFEEQVTVSNQSLKMAEAHFRQARAMIRYNRAAGFPTISIAPAIVGERESQQPSLACAPTGL